MAKQTRKNVPSAPTPPIVYLALFVLLAMFAWYWHLPPMPCLLAGLVASGASARYPQPPSGRRTDPIPPKQLDSFNRWKDLIRAFRPSAHWIQIRRVYWWMGLPIGLLTGASLTAPLLALNLLASWTTCVSVAYSLNRRVERRHPYDGVSIPAAFDEKTPMWAKLAMTLPSLTLLTPLLALAYLGLVPAQTALGLPGLLFLLSVWVSSRKRQSQHWRDLVQWQQTIDGWASAPDLKRAWEGAWLTDVAKNGQGDRRMTVLRIRFQTSTDADAGEGGRQTRSNEAVFKLGVEPLRAVASSQGYDFVVLLPARNRNVAGFEFDRTMARVVLGKDGSCIPPVTSKSVDPKTVGLVADIAYALTAEVWHKRSPLVVAHDVSADEGKAAWLLELHEPPSGGDPIGKMNLDWLAGEESPASALGLPLFADLADAFVLAAEDDTPLSDEGNKWRPAGVTEAKSFDRYVQLSRRTKAEQSTWVNLVPKRLSVPVSYYDGENCTSGDGWALTELPMGFAPPATPDDFASLDLTPLNPEAKFIGIIRTVGGMTLITATGAAPTRIDRLNGQQRKYAEAIIYRALLQALPPKAEVLIDTCTQEGRDVPIWRIHFHLGGGATIADARRRSASIQAAAGARHAYWDWRSADEATVWMCDDPYLGVDDLPHWKRRTSQKTLIELALSDAWGVAGITDPSGQAPTVISLGVLPKNHDVLLARFQVPGGVDVERPKHNLGKFLTSAGYSYGRLLPRGDEHGPDRFDMVLAKRSPFPETVMADWAMVGSCGRQEYPLGVDDLGNPVCWSTKATPHVLICGKSGTGKSSAAQVVVAESLLKGNRIIIIDPSKGAVDFAQWARPKALAFIGNGQLRETEAAVAWLRHEMSLRTDLNDRYGVGNVRDLDDIDLPPEDREHTIPITLVFDEFNSYLQERGDLISNPDKDIRITNDNAETSARNASISRTMSNLSKIAVQGRSTGINLILGAQRLTMDDMRKFNGNAFFRTLGRVLLGGDSPAGVMSQGNLSEANRLQKTLKGSGGAIPVGRGMYETADNALSAVQTWYSGGQAALAELVKDIPAAPQIDLTPWMPRESERFTALTAEELQRRLAPDTGSEDPTYQTGVSEDDFDIEDIEEVEW